MPNAPKTPTRTLRVSDELWGDLQQIAVSKGVTITSIIINYLEQYVAENKPKKVEYGEWQ
jgi:hypothetical protein